MTELTIESLAAGGDGVGHLEGGKVVFIPATAPGDRVAIELTEEKKSFARGRVLRLLEPGPSRRDSGCPYFDSRRCGGCQWLHVSDEVQRQVKRELVATALRHAVDRGLEIAEIEAPAPPLHWRRRARLSWFRRRGEGRALVGFIEPRGDRVADIEVCLQLSPALSAALEAIRAHLAPGLHKRGEIDLLEGASGELVCSVRGPCNRAALEALAADPAIDGARAGHLTFGREVVELEGGVLARAGDFAQSSAAGNRALRDQVAVRAGRPARALELYAGGGNLTQILSDAAGEVVAVERGGGPRFEAANVAWRRGQVEQVCADLVAAGERFDLIVLDPPRRGAREVIGSVAELGDRLLYVSCDPPTLGRDLDALAALGLVATRAQPIDLMPQTSHVEIVCEIER